MSLLGIHFTLLIGPTVAVPAPPELVEMLDRVEVTHSDEGRSGFQMAFRITRNGPLGAADFPVLASFLLRPFNRVIMIVTVGAIPYVLMDGIITNHQVQPGPDPGSASLTVTGEDVSVMMDLHDESHEYPAMDEQAIATLVILKYGQYGLIPMTSPPPTVDIPNPVEEIAHQEMHDLSFLQEVASRFGYVFYILPGPAPFTNIAYWGPPIRVGVVQRALSVNLGPETNVDSLSFQNNALTPTLVSGDVQDPRIGTSIPVQTFLTLRLPLASMPAILVNQPNVRTTRIRESGISVVQAYARAQGTTDASADILTAEGELDTERYGGILHARALVGVRGMGVSLDGLYYVKRVSHTIQKGKYKQRFTLTRDGYGTTTPAVVP